MKNLNLILSLLLISSSPVYGASKETLKGCLAELGKINESNELHDAFSNMLEAYLGNCETLGLCTYDFDEELNKMIEELISDEKDQLSEEKADAGRRFLEAAEADEEEEEEEKEEKEGAAALETVEDEPTPLKSPVATADKPKKKKKGIRLYEMPPVKGSATIAFNDDFHLHQAVVTYEEACKDVGISHGLTCIDGELRFQGNALAAFISPKRNHPGVETDLTVYMKGYPICLPTVCREEDMTKMMEAVFKTAVLKSPDVQENLDAKNTAMIQATTVEQLCALSGLETCEIDTHTSAQCVSSPASSSRSLSYLTGAALSIAAGMFALW